MVRKRSVIIAALVASTLAVIGMASAHAATQVPFTITETNIVFTGDSDHGDFTATGPLCPAGTFVDTYQALAGLNGHGLETVLTETVYTCADGSGTFNMQKHIRLVALPPGIDNTGPVQFLGGTGAYAGLTGRGVDNGANGVGHISGTIVQP
jgi:hypothetical protein